MTLPITPSQTIGPFSHEAWRWAIDAGEGAITIGGVLRDGAGEPITDGMIEAWLPAGAAGLRGFLRAASGDDGGFQFSVPRPAAGEPALLVTVFARGLLVHQFSAVFLADDAALADAPILRQVPQARRATLVARQLAPDAYEWDIHMQGEAETVFFDYA